MAEKSKFGLKDFWYYYKIPLILVVACAVILAVLISQCASQPDYDYEVTLYMARPVPEEVADLMAAQLEQHGQDLNGDGQVRVEIINCTYSADAVSTVRLGQIGKFQARLATQSSALFLLDETCYASVEDTGLFAAVPGFDAKEGHALALENTPFAGAVQELAGNLLPAHYYLCLRETVGTGFQGEAEAEEACRQGQALIQQLMTAYGITDGQSASEPPGKES